MTFTAFTCFILHKSVDSEIFLRLLQRLCYQVENSLSPDVMKSRAAAALEDAFVSLEGKLE